MREQLTRPANCVGYRFEAAPGAYLHVNFASGSHQCGFRNEHSDKLFRNLIRRNYGYTHQQMNGSELDFCLSIGYFRMQQEIFTCRYIYFDDKLCPVHWLRIALANVSYGPKQARLLRINEKFSVTLRPFVLSEEMETLYAIYRNGLNFDAPESVEACLLGGAIHSVFDTYAIEVRHEHALIAVGIFDNGERSIAGIMNFYHPDYHRQSLGKYLMLMKIKYAQRQGKEYYYPGYMVSGYAKFDYKLFACEAATEVFDESRDRWLPFSWETINRLLADRVNEG